MHEGKEKIVRQHRRGAPTIPNVINQLKGYSSKKIGFSVWQKLYYDHVIRDLEDYETKWEYIENNPMTWCERNDIDNSDLAPDVVAEMIKEKFDL